MPRRQARPTLPTVFLMTDERLGDGLWAALARLPRGAGVVFRHYTLPPAARRALFEAVRRVTRRRRLVLLLAGSPRAAIAWRADGAHGRSPHRCAARPLIRTAPAHDRTEWIRAERGGCDLMFVSPLFATRSHPGAVPLGRVRAGLMAGTGRGRAVSLGGLTHDRFRALRSMGFVRWGAIDAWSAES
jgi:thiamine-phosphate pyrophosphorylase